MCSPVRSKLLPHPHHLFISVRIDSHALSSISDVAGMSNNNISLESGLLYEF